MSWLTQAAADTTAPTISDTTFDDPTDTATFVTTEGGNLHWAIHLSTTGIPVLNDDGSWTGATIETGSGSIAASGAGSFEPVYTATTGDRLTYGIIDAAGNVSNLITTTFTPEAPPAPPAGITQVGSVYENTTSSASRTFAAVDIGAAAATRDIIVLAWCGNTAGTTITGVTVGGVTATLVVGRISASGGLGYASAWKVRVPTGTTGDVVVTYSQANAAGAIAILRGLDVTVSTAASNAASTTSNTSVSYTGATVGHDLFVLNAGANGATTWGAGVTEIFDEQIGTANNSYGTLARGTVGGTGAGTITISRDSGGNSQWATIAFAAGEA